MSLKIPGTHLLESTSLIRYYQTVVDRPADQELIDHISSRLDEGKLPCPVLPCAD